jgi:hypothetical protein
MTTPRPPDDVFEADLTLQVSALGWEAWRDSWLLLAHGVALNGRVIVLHVAAWVRQLSA